MILVGKSRSFFNKRQTVNDFFCLSNVLNTIGNNLETKLVLGEGNSKKYDMT